jgi:hypothetical protein
MTVGTLCFFIALNERNSEVKHLHTGGHTVYGEMRMA